MENIIFIIEFINIFIKDNYYLSIIVFFLFFLIYSTFSLPGAPILLLSAGYFFGLYIGFFISIISLTFGSLFFHIFISFLIKKFFPNTFNIYSNKVNKYIHNSSIEYLIIFRIIPGPPLVLQNLCLSILKIQKSKFFISSIIGFSPFTFISVYLGFQITNIEILKNFNFKNILTIEFFIFIFLIVIILMIRIFYKKKIIS